jgi:hypothetical protein
MKKLSLFAVIVGLYVVAISSCTPENGPYINFFGAKPQDTNYLATVETPQTRNVMIEEMTGQSCPNCPEGHDIIKTLETTTYPGHIITTGYYVYNFQQANPVKQGTTVLSKYDFRTNDATNISAAMFGTVGFEPSAVIDRVCDNTSGFYLDRSVWSTVCSTRMAVPPPANMYITSKYDSLTKKVTVDVKVCFTQSYSKKVNLTVGITEDGIVDWQEDSNAPSYYDTTYTFNHVFRAKLTDAYVGDPVLDSSAKFPYSTKLPGQVYERIFIYTVTDPTWNLNNCKVFAFTNDNVATNDKIVLQAVQTNLK